MVKNQRVIFEQNIKLIWSKTKVSEILESCKQATMYILSQLTFCHVHTRATNSDAWTIYNLTNEIDFYERMQDGEKTTPENGKKLH
jgi:hypothetical protein